MKVRALIIDDSAPVRGVVERFLHLTRLAEFQCLQADDGQQALDRYGIDGFDVVFVDIHMPHLNGIEYAKRLRGTKGGRSIPIVFITGDHSVGKLEDALDTAEADAYLTKPFDFAQLKAVVTKVLARLETEAGERKSASRGFFSRLLGER